MSQNRKDPAPRPDALNWLVLANAARARIFERDDDNGALREIAGAVHTASREKESSRGADRPGRAHKGVASTAFEPHTPARERELDRFAHELAQTLESAALAHRMPGLVLMASNPFLGRLKAQLGPAARALLKADVVADFTVYQGADLEHRVSQALGQKAGAGQPEPRA